MSPRRHKPKLITVSVKSRLELSDRSPRIISRTIVFCSVALFVLLAIPLLTGRMFTLDDLGAYHIPLRYLYWTALHNGDSTLWTPAIFAGYYAFGEGQVGMAHPWHLLVYRFLPLTIAFNVEIISGYVALFAGMVMLLKEFGCSREARWFGAMTFTFSGYNLFHLIHVNIVATVAHIPWMLLFTSRLIRAEDRRKRWRAFIGLACVVGSQLLIAHTQHVWFALLLTAALCGYYVWRKAPLRSIGLVALSFAVGWLVAAVQLLPLLDVVQTSQRTEWTAASSLSFSLLKVNIIQLWAPFAFQHGMRAIADEEAAVHEFVVYNSAFCTMALAWMAIRWKTVPPKPAVWGLLIVAVVSLVLAFGRYGGLYPVIVGLPGLRWFRAPARHVVLMHLALSMLAAFVFDDLLNLVRRREVIAVRRLWPLAIPATLSVGTVIVTSILIARGSSEPLSPFTANVPWVVLFLAVALLFAAAARGWPWALPLLVVVTASDQSCRGFPYIFGNPSRPPMTLEEVAHLATIPGGTQPGDRVERKWDNGLHNLPILSGMGVWPGYVGLAPALRLHWGVTTTRLVGAKWAITGSEVAAIPSPAPRARLMTDAQVSADIASEISTIDILRKALVDEPIEGLSGTPGFVRVLEDRPGRITVATNAASRQLLVLTERFHPGWHVTDEAVQHTGVLSRASIHPVPVDGDFLGCVVEAGVHRVTFAFQPRSFRYGLLLTIVGIFVLLCLIPVAML